MCLFQENKAEVAVEVVDEHINVEGVDEHNDVEVVESDAFNILNFGSDYCTPIVEEPNCAGCLTLADIRKKKEKSIIIDQENADCRKETINDNKKKRKWDRKNCCPFCHILVTNFARNIVKHHPFEEKVKEYTMILDENLKEIKRKRMAITDKLRKKGNYDYNLKVTNKGN